MDLSFNLAPSYWDLKDPTSRQNFEDTVEQKRVIDLRACHDNYDDDNHDNYDDDNHECENPAAAAAEKLWIREYGAVGGGSS